MICALLGRLVRVDWAPYLTTGVGTPPSIVPHSLRRTRPLVTSGERRISNAIQIRAPRSVP